MTSFGSLSELQRPHSPRAARVSWRWCFQNSSPAGRVTATALIALAVDWQRFWQFGPSWRYGLMLILVVLAIAAASSEPRAPDRRMRSVPLLCCAFAVPSGMWFYAMWFDLPVDRTYVLWLPLLVPILLATKRPSGEASRGDAKLLTSAGLVLTSSLLLQQVLTGQMIGVTHESLFIVWALWFFYIARRSLSGVVLSSLVIYYDFTSYPALTVVLVPTVVVFWVSICSLRKLRSQMVAVILGAIALSAVGNLTQLAVAYFAISGKGNNLDTREGLLSAGYERVMTHPFVGDTLTGSITAKAIIHGQFMEVPTHNGFLSLLLAGGLLLGVAVVSTWIVAVLRAGSVLRSYSLPSSRLYGGEDRALAVLVSTALVGGMVTLTFNPVIELLNTSFVFYCFIGLALTLAPNSESVVSD